MNNNNNNNTLIYIAPACRMTSEALMNDLNYWHGEQFLLYYFAIRRVCWLVGSFVRYHLLGPNISKTLGDRGSVPVGHQ